MLNRFSRWMLLIASSAVLLQTAGCDVVLQTISTGLLAVLTGTTIFLARNI